MTPNQQQPSAARLPNQLPLGALALGSARIVDLAAQGIGGSRTPSQLIFASNVFFILLILHVLGWFICYCIGRLTLQSTPRGVRVETQLSLDWRSR